MGTFEQTIIFNILDFDHGGFIKKEDVKLLLSYLPIDEEDERDGLAAKTVKNEEDKNDLVTKIFGTQMKSLEEIDKLLNEQFSKYENNTMNVLQFTDLIIKQNFEIFLQILCFLYSQMPFTPENVNAMKIKYNDIKDKDLQTMGEEYKGKKKTLGSICIKTPKQGALLSPGSAFLKKTRKRKFSLNEPEKNECRILVEDKGNTLIAKAIIDFNGKIVKKLSKSISPEPRRNKFDEDAEMKKNNYPYIKNMDIVRLNNENFIDQNNKFMNAQNINIKQIIDNSKQGYTSPSKYLHDKRYINHLDLNNKNYYNYGT